MNFKEKEHQLVEEAKQEFEHIADPSQCGIIVRSHFNGITIGIFVFILLFVLAAIGGIMFYNHHQNRTQAAPPAIFLSGMSPSRL